MKSKKLLAGLLSLSILFASACSNDVESPKEETKTEEKAVEKARSNSGTFEGVGKGLNGDVKIELTYEDGEIKDVKVVEHKESEGIADPALEQIPAKIVEEQNINVDTVSGATVTSTAIIDAVKQALEAAGANADDFIKEAEETSKEGQTIE
ncbi:FMN-binding protein [uncultured Anaerococcus sp.]|uniref:FMN-binding protein n=1 Tax=uncultured Anaerococcus sp. TaxID=293428 RepID=UPI002624F4D5|nr:FMN-binding protein [uncultured Anaerococcus sp.]